MFSSLLPNLRRNGNAAPRQRSRRGSFRSSGAALGLALGLGSGGLPLLAQGDGAMPQGSAPTTAGARRVPISSRATPLDVRMERRTDSLDLVISGVGSGPQLQQSRSGDTWLGRLFVARPTLLRRGPQTLSLPEQGIQSLTVSGGGNQFDLRMTPVPGYPIGQPVVSADGSSLIISFSAAPQASLQTYSRDLRMPGRVPQPEQVPPLQPRAVAPPVGDMAVGSILIGNSGYVNLSGPPITLRLARPVPARVVLTTLARNGGYGFVYVNDTATGQQGSGSGAAGGQERPVSVDFRNESYARAVNSVLLAAGLQGKLEGNTLMVGTNVLSKGFGAKLSKVYRLNQVSANSAADYLANLGAQVTKTNTITTSVTQGISQNQAVATSPSSATTQSSTTTTVEAYGAATGPLVGLQATTDSRLSTITLVGDPRVVAVAETYLRQMDLRQRQVALSVKILDVTLDNDKKINNSFAFRYGNNFIVNDSGQLLGAFGALLPPTANQFEGMANGILANPPSNPGMLYEKNLYDFLRATIESGSTKVLASPTLILSENSEELRSGDDQLAVNTQAIGTTAGSGGGGGSLATIGRTKANESFVTVGEQVITNYTVTTGTQGNGNSCQPQFGIAGLTFGARVQKIDDNGFVTFSMSPSITASVDRTNINNCGLVDILAVRRLDSGSARVRDGQTLILTGVISDRDTQIVSKWPILGDIPLIGQFFRSSSGNRAKRELVIMVTPRIIDDTQGGTWGYGYQPASQDTRRFLGSGSAGSPF